MGSLLWCSSGTDGPPILSVQSIHCRYFRSGLPCVPCAAPKGKGLTPIRTDDTDFGLSLSTPPVYFFRKVFIADTLGLDFHVFRVLRLREKA